MYLLIIFFISLLGTVFMIGRKMVLLKRGHAEVGEPLFELPPVHKVRNILLEKTRALGYALLVIIIRIYVRALNLILYIYGHAKKAVQKFLEKNGGTNGALGEKEVSKFLKKISEYKQKIRNIKHRIKEEERIE